MTDDTGRDLLHRALDEYSSGHEFPEPVATVRRRVRRHQARVWTAAGVGAVVLLSSAGVAIGGVVKPSHDTLTTRPTPTPSSSGSAAPSASPTPRAVRVTFAKAERKVLVTASWGSGPGEWGLLTGGDDADAGPTDLVTDGRGHLYVLDAVNRRLLVYSAATGHPLADASTTLPFSIYLGAAADPATGDVYVHEYTGKLLRVSDRKVTATISGHFEDGSPSLRYYASRGTVEALTTQGDAPQPRRATLLTAGAPVTAPRLRPVAPSLTAPALELTDWGQLTLRFGPDSVIRPDFDARVVEAGDTVVAAPGVVWLTVRTEFSGHWRSWLARITPDSAVAMPLPVNSSLPYEIQRATLAATAGSAFTLVGDASGGRIVEYVPGKPLRP